MFILIKQLPRALLYQSTAGPHLAQLYLDLCGPLSQQLQTGISPPVCMPGLLRVPGDLKVTHCREHPQWRPLVRSEDRQSQYTLESTQRSCKLYEKAK